MTSILLAAHLLGVILWIGGSVTGALVVALAADAARRETAAAARRALLFVASPGMVLAWVAGLAVLLPSFTTAYARAGWMHGKLTVALVASGLTGFLMGKLRKAASGQAGVAEGALRGVAIAIVVLAAVVVVLVMLRPGA